MKRPKLRGAIIGGGKNSYIGKVHIIAATMENYAEITAGVFSSNREKSLDRGIELGIKKSRIYESADKLIEEEMKLPKNERIDFLIIAGPNSTHAPIAILALNAGFNVISEKPAGVSLQETLMIEKAKIKSGKIYMLNYGYTGYPMVKEAANMVLSGEIGDVSRLVVNYSQGWLADMINNKQTMSPWRLDYNLAGPSCTLLDIGTHAENLVKTITGLEIEELCADLLKNMIGNDMDDGAHVLIRYRGGAKGVMTVSQTSIGEKANFSIKIYGKKKSLLWNHDDPDRLKILLPEGGKYVIGKESSEICDAAKKAVSLSAKRHTIGVLGAVQTLYNEVFESIHQNKSDGNFPGIKEGISSLSFVEACIKSSSLKKWVKVI